MPGEHELTVAGVCCSIFYSFVRNEVCLDQLLKFFWSQGVLSVY